VGTLLALALPFAGCARDPYVSTVTTVPAGSWRIERQTDRVTGKPVNSAFVNTRSSSNASVAFPHPATLQLSCFLDRPVVRFVFEFKIGTNLNSFLGYRFDEKPGHEIGARFVQDSTAVMIEEPADVAQFVSDLTTSNTLYIRIRSLNAGRSSAEFKVDGAPEAIAAAFAGCPVVPPAPPPPQAKPSSRRRSA
jgi:hypothetical protein